MNASLATAVMVLYLFKKGETNCGIENPVYDVGCYRQRSNLIDHSAESMLKIMLHKLPCCREGGVWMHYQCNHSTCYCVYVDTGRSFILENISEEQLRTNPDYWEDACPVKSERRKDSCHEPPITYPCLVNTTKYVYDANAKQCLPTTGCFGFSDRNTCENVCGLTGSNNIDSPLRAGSSQCFLPVSVGGTCKDGQPSTRYWYNSSSGMCQRFHYLGCEGNSNNYPSIWGCKQRCSDLLPPENEEPEQFTPQQERRLFPSQIVCNQPRIIDIQCRAIAQRRWYYDSETSKCCSFLFCGLGGNGNNFESEEDCNNFCATPPVLK